MYIPTITQTSKNPDGSQTIIVQFLNDQTNLTRIQEFDGIISDTDLKNKILNQIAFYTQADNIQITPGPVDLTPVVVPPSPDQQEEQDFTKALDLLRQYDKAVKLGVLKVDDANYLQALTDVQQKFQTKYINLF